MARITVEDCLEQIPSLFDLVLTASKRSRRLANGAESMVDWENDKPTVVALREIAAGFVTTDILIENEQQKALEAVFDEPKLPSLSRPLMPGLDRPAIDDDLENEEPGWKSPAADLDDDAPEMKSIAEDLDDEPELLLLDQELEGDDDSESPSQLAVSDDDQAETQSVLVDSNDDDAKK